MSAEVVADILQWLSTTLPFANVAIAASSVSAWISLKTTTLLLGIVFAQNATSPSKARALGKTTARWSFMLPSTVVATVISLSKISTP